MLYTSCYSRRKFSVNLDQILYTEVSNYGKRYLPLIKMIKANDAATYMCSQSVSINSNGPEEFQKTTNVKKIPKDIKQYGFYLQMRNTFIICAVGRVPKLQTTTKFPKLETIITKE